MFLFFVVEGDPNNYLTYFKRGTVYLALGKAKSAIADLDKVIEFRPDFVAVSICSSSIESNNSNLAIALNFHFGTPTIGRTITNI